MTQAAKAQEPTMEEILASIRRIIADDDALKTPVEPNQSALTTPRVDESQLTARPAAKASASGSSSANGRHDISAMLGSFDAPNTVPAEPAQPDLVNQVETKSTSGLGSADGKADTIFNASESPPATNTVADAKRQIQQNMPERPLLAPQTTAAVDSAFNALAHSVLAKNARTLDELVSEMLRPMLKAWLDENLPDLVERIVRDEIERVSRGRGGTK
jgi:cell pole-organizing protein PopZ